MLYEEARVYLDKVSGYGSVPGLDSIRYLLEELGNPQDRLRFIHIAGTNGKGSVLALLTQVLTCGGIRTGTYLSPSVFGYLEKFQMNGARMTEEELPYYVEKVKAAADRMVKMGHVHPTVFEIETAIAFQYFLEKRAEIVVLETGMGGLLDATNIVRNTEVCIFTPISMDHMSFLGDTLEGIAQMKAGIMKPGADVVISPQKREVRDVLLENARDAGLKVTEICRNELKLLAADAQKQSFTYKGYECTVYLAGRTQLENAMVVLETVEILRRRGFEVDQDAVLRGFENTRWPGRLQYVDQRPGYVVDGAHNPGAVRRLAEYLDTYFPGKKFDVVMGVFKDKDYPEIAEIIAPYAENAFTIDLPNRERTLPKEALADVLMRAGIPAKPCASVASAIEKATKCAAAEGRSVLIFGSLSYLCEALRVLGTDEKERMTPVDKLYRHPKYQEYLRKNAELEEGRIYCGHDLQHFLDVARLAYIFSLERGYKIPKEKIYLAALLHDIGRWQQYEDKTPHEKASAKIAQELLAEIGYPPVDTKAIMEAILCHRDRCDRPDPLTEVLYDADKISRKCFCCPAEPECNWSDIKKNHQILW